jgi:hypothetical protein
MSASTPSPAGRFMEGFGIRGCLFLSDEPSRSYCCRASAFRRHQSSDSGRMGLPIQSPRQAFHHRPTTATNFRQIFPCLFSAFCGLGDPASCPNFQHAGQPNPSTEPISQAQTPPSVGRADFGGVPRWRSASG